MMAARHDLDARKRFPLKPFGRQCLGAPA